MICSYREKAWGFEQTMELFDDHITVAGHKRFGVRWERSIPLAGLDPTPSRLWMRHRPYSNAAVFVFFVMMIVTVVVSLLRDAAGATSRANGTVVLLLVVVWIGSVLALLFIRRRFEYAMFNTTGHVQSFTVTCRDAASQQSFDAFVAAVSEQIRKKSSA